MLVNFNVYRSEKREGRADLDVIVATTKHMIDAKAVLKNWHRGFITDAKGLRIEEKNME